MLRPNGPVSLADLASAGVGLRPYEAVTIAREVALQVVRGQIAGVPSPHVVRLSSNGSVSIEGPVAAGDGRPVVRVAQLLDALLPDSDHAVGSEFRVPGGLKLVVARALGTLDLPPYGSLEAFVESLDRFAATDPAAAIAGLVVSFTEATAVRPPQEDVQAPPVVAAQVQPFVAARASEPRPRQPREALTISDIRRARRATGVPLVKVAERSRIPLGLLRQLEWGYFFNWPRGRYGRSQLVRYARAAGLDEELVLSTVTPLIDLAEPPAALPQPAAEPAALMMRPPAEPDVRVSPAATFLVPIEAEEVHRHRRRGGLVAALAAAAAVTILVPMWWDYPEPRAVPPAQGSQAATGTTGVGSAAPSSVPAEAPEPLRETTEVATATPTAPPAATAAPGQPDAGPAVGTTAPAAAPAGAGGYQLASDQAFSPSFASAGTAMFYQDEEEKGSSLVRAGTNSAGGSVLRITRIVDDAANNYHVRPSPDGKRIAFDSDRDGVRGVYVADENGQHVRRVSGEGYAAVPSWSPDSRTLAFARAEPERPKTLNLWTLELESGEMRRITKHADGQLWGGSWFPDGRRIAYSHEDRLIVCDLESGAERVFSTPVKGRPVRTPAVSPDGRRIVFQVDRSGAWLLDFPGGTVRRVLDDPTAEEYTWAPDGKRLAYHSRRSDTWGVWVMASR